MPPEYRARIEASLPAMRQRAEQDYGLPFNPGILMQDSRPALILEKYAESEGQVAAFHDAVMKRMWQEGGRIDDLAALGAILASLGLESDVEALLANPVYEQSMSQDVAQAHQFGLTGVPAIVYAERYLVSGAQPYTVLAQVADRVLSETQESGR
jgi:predicted DsbA family dithiol-disulfide isomerase